METLLHAGLSNALSATFLALLVACLGRVLARRPAILHCLWLLVLLKLVTPPLYEIPISWPEKLTASRDATSEGACAALGEGGTPIYLNLVGTLEPLALDGPEAKASVFGLATIDDRPADGPAPAAIARALEWLSQRWMPIVAVIWVAGTLATLVISVRRILRFQVLLRETQPASDDVQDWVDHLSASLGVSRAPQVWWIGGKLSPMLWALGGCPRLIIPIDLWKGLDHRQRGTLLVHELAHLRRGDHRVRIFELVVTALYWWNPVLWWARQALRDVEEQCCDAWVVWAFPESAKSYAETLLETLDFLNHSELSEPLLASGFGKVYHLRRRLTMIMNGTTPRLVSLWGALGALALGALLLPVNATWAQAPDESKEIRVVVKTDDDPAKVSKPAETVNLSTTAWVTDSDGKADIIVFTTDPTKPAQVVEKTNFNLVLTTDDSSVSVSADSVDDAIKKINEQIETLKKNAPLGDKEKSQQEALLKMAKQLEEMAKSNKRAQAGDGSEKGNFKSRARFIIRDTQDVKTTEASPEKKAQIEKARARIKELSAALAAAQSDLAKLEGHAARTVTVFRTPGVENKLNARYKVVSPQITTDNLNIVARKKVEGQTADEKVVVKKLETAPGGRFTIEPKKAELYLEALSPGHVEEDRIQALEKKLNKLLEEVASLKKDRDK